VVKERSERSVNFASGWKEEEEEEERARSCPNKHLPSAS
jgi:hypothetical protein